MPANDKCTFESRSLKANRHILLPCGLASKNCQTRNFLASFLQYCFYINPIRYFYR